MQVKQQKLFIDLILLIYLFGKRGMGFLNKSKGGKVTLLKVKGIGSPDKKGAGRIAF